LWVLHKQIISCLCELLPRMIFLKEHVNS
jgi:hypothetical protein